MTKKKVHQASAGQAMTQRGMRGRRTRTAGERAAASVNFASPAGIAQILVREEMEKFRLPVSKDLGTRRKRFRLPAWQAGQELCSVGKRQDKLECITQHHARRDPGFEVIARQLGRVARQRYVFRANRPQY